MEWLGVSLDGSEMKMTRGDIPAVRMVAGNVPGIKIWPELWWTSGAVMPWDCVAAYQTKGATGLDASYINLAKPGTYNAFAGTAPTWDASNGWIFNGTTQYLKTGILPGSGWSVIVKYTNLTSTGNRALIGSYNPFTPNGGWGIVAHHTAGMQTFNGSSSFPGTNAPQLTTGTYGMAGLVPYRNGSPDPNQPSGAGTFGEIYIGALNYNGTAVQLAPVYIQAVAIYNIVLTATQMSEISNAMMAL